MSDLIKVPDFAPGCFGSALNHDPTDPICSNCPFVRECGAAHLVTMESLRRRFGIVVPEKIREAERAKIENAVKTPVRTVGGYAAATIEAIKKAGVDVAFMLRRGENPFGVTIKSEALRVASYVLIKSKQPVQRAVIAACIERRLGCKPETAKTYARIAEQVLLHFGAVEVDEKRTISIKR